MADEALKTTLSEYADEFVSEREAQISQLEAKLSKIQEEQLEIERSLHSARFAGQRALQYSPVMRGQVVCLRCWIESETLRRLISVAGGTKTHDVWECSHCHTQFEVRFRK
jgi:transposase-like protein